MGQRQSLGRSVNTVFRCLAGIITSSCRRGRGGLLFTLIDHHTRIHLTQPPAPQKSSDRSARQRPVRKSAQHERPTPIFRSQKSSRRSPAATNLIAPITQIDWICGPDCSKRTACLHYLTFHATTAGDAGISPAQPQAAGLFLGLIGRRNTRSIAMQRDHGGAHHGPTPQQSI
jgi:hypothetical protein